MHTPLRDAVSISLSGRLLTSDIRYPNRGRRPSLPDSRSQRLARLVDLLNFAFTTPLGSTPQQNQDSNMYTESPHLSSSVPRFPIRNKLPYQYTHPDEASLRQARRSGMARRSCSRAQAEHRTSSVELRSLLNIPGPETALALPVLTSNRFSAYVATSVKGPGSNFPMRGAASSAVWYVRARTSRAREFGGFARFVLRVARTGSRLSESGRRR